MSAIDSKFHIKIGDFGFILAKMPRADRHHYEREEAPAFVNKFSSGEPNYRDSTFFPHWVQLNWQNGFNQEFFDDGGKFYRSSSVDTTQPTELTLQKKFSSSGLTAADVKILTQMKWRSTASSAFAAGEDGTLTISANTTDSPIDSACTGTLGSTSLLATNASFTGGQVILIIQMYGSGAGQYQKTEITSYSTGIITTRDALAYTFVTGAQVVVMKRYSAVTIDSGKTLTAKAWDGTVGGILAFICSGTTTVTGTITATGKGFAGGTKASGSGVDYGNPGNDSYYAGEQGDGTSTGAGVANTKAANGNGGGGGGWIGGGGGGGHAAAASNVTNTFSSSTTSGGSAVGIAALTSLFMGGGGGGGGADWNTDSGGNGGNGGGIIYIQAVTLTVTGSIVSGGNNGSNYTSGTAGGGGGGAGGSVLLKVQTATLGTNLITAPAGSAGTSGGSAANASAGSVGRIHISYLTSFTGTTTPTIDSSQDGTLTTTSADAAFSLFLGCSDGKIYSWDGASTFTEEFDTRRLTWYDDIAQASDVRALGDSGGTEHAVAQGFQLSATTKVKAAQVYIRKETGTPGDITVRIETNNAGVPSGTLAHASATTTIPAFSTSSSSWVTATFATAFSLTASTQYWLVLKLPAAANDNNYYWSVDTSSPSYTGGTDAVSTDGGSTWSAASNDMLFRILGNSTSVNCSIVSDIVSAGTNKGYFGVGDPLATENGDGRIYSYDGTNFALVKTFNSTNESSVLSMCEYGPTTRTIFIGLGHKAKVYKTTDFSSFTLSKTITQPDNPGYVFALTEYNGKLYAGGGHPENLNDNNSQYSGFLYSYDEYSWNKLGDFSHTVIKSLESFDTLLFIGTIKKFLYVFNTATVDKLFEFPWDVQVTSMVKWDDKLALALAPTPGSAATGNEGIYLFDRNGLHNAFNVSSTQWYSVGVFNNNLVGGSNTGYVYQTSPNTYQASGTIQTSYDEASLPSIEKIRRSVQILYESLVSGCSIQVEYKTDEADASWTSLGTASTAGSTSATFNFASGVYSKKITFRITLATSTPASSPVLKKILHKYVLSPDFKYRWTMRILCVDNITWLDGTEPVAILGSSVSANATSITLKSTHDATPTAGFPDPNGSAQYATIETSAGVRDVFTYTGKTATTLTGIPSSGSNALSSHSAGEIVRITGSNIHKQLLDLKTTRQLYTFTDFDGLTYTALFHAYSSGNWAINMIDDPRYGGSENEAPITLLEA